jgi:hypothetical protein
VLHFDVECGNSGVFKGKFKHEIKDAVNLGFKWTAVKWSDNPRSACVLVYNYAEDKIKEAVEYIARVSQWVPPSHSIQ